jgi:IS5 family transposase
MRGGDAYNEALFTTVKLDEVVPASRLLEVARDKIVRLAKRAGIKLKLTHEREGKTLRWHAAGYAHARQFRLLKKVLRRQRTILGSVMREVQRTLGEVDQGTRDRPLSFL